MQQRRLDRLTPQGYDVSEAVRRHAVRSEAIEAIADAEERFLAFKMAPSFDADLYEISIIRTAERRKHSQRLNGKRPRPGRSFFNPLHTLIHSLVKSQPAKTATKALWKLA